MKREKKTPLLRFNEFKDEWDRKLLGEIGETFNGLTGKSKEDFGQGKPYIQYKQIFDDSKIDISRFELVKIGINENQNKVQFGDVFFTVSSETSDDIGMSSVLLDKIDELYLNSFCFGYRANSLKILSPYFSRYLFRNEIFRKTIVKLAQGSTRYNMSKVQLMKLEINLPSLQEQNKISSFLTAIDDKIKSLKKKQILLQQYKKGIMQKLFSQELRFKDDKGNKFPKWEVKKLGEVSEIIMGQSPSSNSYNSDKIGIPLIQGNADIQNRLSNPRNWTTEKTKECKIGDLILTVRAPVGSVAKSVHNACIGRGVCAIRNNTKSINEFIYQFLLDFETKWSSIEQGSTFTAVSSIEIKKLEINLPSLYEQTKIANFLSSLDSKIQSTIIQIQQTQEYKKGLLQKMFC